MNVSQLLQQHDITLQQASDWIQAHLDTPAVVYDTALQFGIDSTMLAEIVQPWVPGANAALVESFFAQHGLDAMALRYASMNDYTDDGVTYVDDDGASSGFLPGDLAALASLVEFNSNVGILSTASLRNTALEQITPDLYWGFFDPAGYDMAGDGVLDAFDMGVPSWSGVAATPENIESVYYGTLINVFQSMDMAEMQQIIDFTAANQTGLWDEDPATVDAYTQLLVQMFTTPAATPVLNDQMIASWLSGNVAATAQVVGAEDGTAGSVLSGLFM